mgnify:CR=1 FL=1
MGTVTSGNIVAGGLQSGAGFPSNTYVSHANSTVSIEATTEYTVGGQEIETYNLTELSLGEAFVYEKSGAGKLQGYEGFCLVSDQKDGSQIFVNRGPTSADVVDYGDAHHDSGGGITNHNSTSMYFDGTGDYLNVLNAAFCNFGTDDFTIDFWIYYNNTSAGNGIANFSSSTWQLTHGSGPQLYFQNSSGFSDTVTGSMGSGAWKYIAIVRSSGYLYSFVDGKMSRAPTSFATSPSGTGSLDIGRHTSSYYLNAYLDDFRISKGVARYAPSDDGFNPPSRSPKGTEAIGGIADYTKITMVGYREDSASYFTAINYVAGDEIIARDYMGIPYGHLQAVAYGGSTQKIMIFNNSTDTLKFTTYVESTT